MLREQLRKNIGIYDYLVKIRRYKNNAAYLKNLNEVSAIDSILEFDKFVDAVERFVEMRVPVEYSVYGGESYYYGYYNEFMQYANIRLPRVPVFPRMEHGVRFGGPLWGFDANCLAYACQGRKRIHEIWENDPWKPVFSLGPYIHYARDYYNESDFQKLKSQLGRCLLVFPSHTSEGVGSRFAEKDLVDIIYEKYAPHFDSVMVCAYWRDAKNSLIEAFRQRGAMTVSAGFRGDKNFIRRLKTIIKLSDAVVGDDLGTNIGFCMCMGKPYYLERVDRKRSEDETFECYKDLFYGAFCTDTLEFTQEQLEQQRDLYNDFWGGDASTYSADEAKYLINLVLGIYKEANYQVDAISDVIKNRLNSSKDPMERRILQDAVRGAEETNNGK